MAAEELLGRPCRWQRAPGTTPSYRLGTSCYTIVRSTMQYPVKQDKHVKGSWTYTNPDKYDDDTSETKERCFSC
jgi:hypothetical protein